MPPASVRTSDIEFNTFPDCVRPVFSCLIEQCLHGRIITGQSFNRQCFGFVVCQTKIIFTAQQFLFNLLQVADGLILKIQ